MLEELRCPQCKCESIYVALECDKNEGGSMDDVTPCENFLLAGTLQAIPPWCSNDYRLKDNKTLCRNYEAEYAFWVTKTHCEKHCSIYRSRHR